MITLAGRTFRITAASNSGIGIGDRIAFSPNPSVSSIYRVVGVEAAPGQYDELYVVAGT